MRTLQLHIGLAVAATILATTVAGMNCEERRESQWFMTERDSQGYSIRFANPADARKEVGLGGSSDRAYAAADQLPPNRASVVPPAEYLADAAQAAVFFLARPSIRVPVPLAGVWRGADPLSCLRSFAQTAGLDVVVPQPGLWLIGPPEMLQHSALEVFTYRLGTTLQPLQSDAAIGELERALLSYLPIRDVGPLALVGLGYYAIPGEPDNYLVVVTHGSRLPPVDSDELETWAFKVLVQQQESRADVQCLWRRGVSGPLLAAVQEDFDGDGVRDFYFQAAGDKPDLIVSGSDGSTLAAVAAGSLAIETSAVGAKRFAVDWLWGNPQGHAVVCRVSPELRKAVMIGGEVKAEAAEKGAGSHPVRQNNRPRDALAEVLGHREGIRNYVLPGSRPPGYRTPGVPGVEYVEVQPQPVWAWFVNRNPKKIIESTPSDLAMHVLYKYLSPGYLKERESEKAAVQK